MLKEAKYKCWGSIFSGFPEFNKVVYVIIGNRCYFSGIEIENRTSTINAAESIIEAIAQQESLPLRSLRYFDLQTFRGYEDKKPGIFDLDELILEARSNNIRCWKSTSCPEKVKELFKKYIGELDNSVKIWKPEEARRAGYEPGEMHSLNSGSCFLFVQLHNKSCSAHRQLAGSSLHLALLAERITGPAVHDDFIVVDQNGNQELLEISDGDRYRVWQRNTIGDN